MYLFVGSVSQPFNGRSIWVPDLCSTVLGCVHSFVPLLFLSYFLLRAHTGRVSPVSGLWLRLCYITYPKIQVLNPYLKSFQGYINLWIQFVCFFRKGHIYTLHNTSESEAGLTHRILLHFWIVRSSGINN